MTRSITWLRGVRLDGACVLALLCSLAMQPEARAAEPVLTAQRTTLVVRVYDGAGLAPRDVREAARVASALLAASSVEVRWRMCPEASPLGGDACRQPLAANEAVLRLVSAREQMPADTASLGSTLLDRAGRQPVMSTVFIDRVLQVARRAMTDPTRLAGRAMAHELGHVLLGTSGHSHAGLMRAFWSDESLRGSESPDWLLLPEQAAAIHANRARTLEYDVAGGS